MGMYSFEDRNYRGNSHDVITRDVNIDGAMYMEM